MLLVIKAGEKLPALASVAGDFEDWIARGMGVAPAAMRAVSVYHGASLPEPATVKAVVITGSGAMVTDDSEWIRSSAAWLTRTVAAGVPTLGICFGHQLLAHALGGGVADNPGGIEVGSVAVCLADAAAQDPLFQGLPSNLRLQASHRQSIRRLPPEARCLATSELEPHHGFAYGNHAWGVQFHPEFSARVTAAYVDYYQQGLTAEGKNPGVLREACVETPWGARLLQNFARLAGL